MLVRRLAVLVLIAAAALPPSAAADARQYTIGIGRHPTVAVVTSGGTTTVHVAWATSSGFAESEGVANAIGYCRLPMGARACRDHQILNTLGRFGEFAAPELWTTDDGALVITDGRETEPAVSGRWLLVSRDGGTTWTATNTSRVSRGNSGLLSRARHLEVLDPADGSLATVGSSFFAFGRPVNFVRIDRAAVAPAPQDAPIPPDFQNDGTRRIDANVLGRLPDGRLFAAGFDQDSPARTLYARSVVPGGNAADPASGWTPWQPLPIAGPAWGAGYSPGRGPTALLVGSGTAEGSLEIAQFDGQAVGRRTLIGGDVGLAANEHGRDLRGADDGRLHATWGSHEEGCRRGTRCLLYIRLDANLRAGAKDVVRSVPDSPSQPILEFGTVASNAAGDAWVAWQERTQSQDAFPKIKLAQMCPVRPTATSLACQPYQASVGANRMVTLNAPNLVTGRSLTASVSGNSAIRRVRLTLQPPFCRPPSTGDRCHALRRPVTVNRTRAPFAATFGRLPVASGTSTSDPLKNRHCAVDAYLYTLVAVVTTASRTVTLRRNVSVCPVVR